MLPERLRRLVQLFGKLPGVGEKTAQRYVLHLVSQGGELAELLGGELTGIATRVKPCSRCGNLAETDPDGNAGLCDVCADHKRDPKLLCVVARIQDLFAIERTGTMRGRYFVLGRLLSPLEGIGPEDLPIEALARRIREDGVTEVILATPPSVDGEATALFLKRELGAKADVALAVSRIASGVPHGGDLEFADPITMGRALAGRQRL